VDEAAFVTNEERVLWNTFLSVKKSINPGIFLHMSTNFAYIVGIIYSALLYLCNAI